jgi:broad specificity phosphatase PhoE
MKAIGPPPPPPGYVPSTDGLPQARSRGLGTRLWLVRHAEVAERWHDMAYGSMDVELSEKGLRDTLEMAAAFEGVSVEGVLSSDLDRARRLGSKIAEATGASLVTTPQLREMNRGAWQGLSKAEFTENWIAEADRYWRDPFRWHTPEGEGDERLFARAWPAVEAALEPLEAGQLVVTAHGQLIRVLISRALGVSVPESYGYYLDPAHASCLVDGPTGWTLAARNLGPHELTPHAQG